MAVKPHGWLGDALDDAIPFAGAVIDAFSQASANKTNRKITRDQMRFQERMSSTEIQRRVADLQAAGLNPMLAGMNQQGASSAQGATTRVEPITRNTASTALASQMQRQQLQNLEAQTKLLAAQTFNVEQDSHLKQTTAAATGQSITNMELQAQQLANQVKKSVVELDITDEQLRTARLTNKQLEDMQPLLVRYQQLLNQAAQLGMTQREVDQKFAEELGEANRYIRFIQQLFGPARTPEMGRGN